jgi:hypothetical protein
MGVRGSREVISLTLSLTLPDAQMGKAQAAPFFA